MKKLLAATVFLCASAGSALAVPPPCNSDTAPTIMAGITFNFGGNISAENFGFTLKALHTNEADHFVVGAGGTFYPWSDERFGLDLSAGYNGSGAAALVGYDFLKKAPVVSGGLVDTEEGISFCPA